MKKYQVNKQFLNNINQDTKIIEKKHRAKQRAKKQKKQEKENLSQRWLAPILLLVTLLLGYLLYLIY